MTISEYVQKAGSIPTGISIEDLFGEDTELLFFELFNRAMKKRLSGSQFSVMFSAANLEGLVETDKNSGIISLVKNAE